MLEGLQTEIDTHPELTGASKQIKMDFLNAPGSANVEAWITAPDPVLVSLNVIYTYYISDESLGKLIAYLQDSANAVMALRLDKAAHIDMTATVVINILGTLFDADVCTQSEHDALIRLGQVKKSRAEELFGRKLTLEDFE